MGAFSTVCAEIDPQAQPCATITFAQRPSVAQGLGGATVIKSGTGLSTFRPRFRRPYHTNNLFKPSDFPGLKGRNISVNRRRSRALCNKTPFTRPVVAQGLESMCTEYYSYLGRGDLSDLRMVLNHDRVLRVLDELGVIGEFLLLDWLLGEQVAVVEQRHDVRLDVLEGLSILPGR